MNFWQMVMTDAEESCFEHHFFIKAVTSSQFVSLAKVLSLQRTLSPQVWEASRNGLSQEEHLATTHKRAACISLDGRRVPSPWGAESIVLPPQASWAFSLISLHFRTGRSCSSFSRQSPPQNTFPFQVSPAWITNLPISCQWEVC